MARVQVILNDVPADVAEAVSADAEQQNRSVNDVAVEALAQAYRVAYQPTRYPYTVPVPPGTWVLRMPVELRDAIAEHAAARAGDTRRGVMLMAWAEHYGLHGVARTPRKRLSAA